MSIRTLATTAAMATVLLAGCNRETEPKDAAPAAAAAMTDAAPAATEAAAPAIVGFDPASAPIADPQLGDFPFFGLLDGYVPMDKQNYSGSPAFKWVKAADYDRYEFFDGHKLIPVEGRFSAVKAMGSGASFFQVQKNYEALVKAAGGVTVYEGTGKPMKDGGIAFADQRHRANYALDSDRMGVYMIRAKDRQIWVEVYKAWESEDESYWLTVVETKPLNVSANLIPAAQLKSALDANGRVAIPVLFDNDAATLKPESGAVIAEAVKLLKAEPQWKLAIEGHTDANGTPARNQALSQARAKAVAGAIAAGGIAADRLVALGFGQDRPVAPNSDDAGRAKNRRVELVKL